MNQTETTAKYVAFLRGINVGGHHKVPMAELAVNFEKLGFKNILTILNSGNIIFESKVDDLQNIEKYISMHLEQHFGFPIPTIVRTAETIRELNNIKAFQDANIKKDLRLYVSFLKEDTNSNLELPWASEDGSYRILEKRDKNILSILDISITKTPKAMELLESHFGKDITTRNLNTLGKIQKKMDANQK